MKKLIAVLFVTFALLGSFPAVAQNCLTPEQNIALGSEAGFTASAEYRGRTASEFMDAFARINNIPRESLPNFDVITLHFNPTNPEVVVFSGYENNCMTIRTPFTPDLIEAVVKALNDMKAEGTQPNG